LDKLACPASYMIVGLGNPGSDYSETRHNIGFKVIDAVAGTYSVSLQFHSADARVGMGIIHGMNVVLVQPMAYMNLTGRPVYRLSKQLELSSENILIVHDDMDLSFGRIKIKEKGGSGGHNGVQSLIDAFGEGGFARLRMGIGHPEAGMSASDYVLSSFSSEESNVLKHFIDQAQDAAVTVLCNGTREGMNRFNRTVTTNSIQTTDGGN